MVLHKFKGPKFSPLYTENAHSYHNLCLRHQPTPKMMPNIVKSHTHSYDGRGQDRPKGNSTNILLLKYTTCEYPSPFLFQRDQSNFEIKN